MRKRATVYQSMDIGVVGSALSYSTSQSSAENKKKKDKEQTKNENYQ